MKGTRHLRLEEGMYGVFSIDMYPGKTMFLPLRLAVGDTVPMDSEKERRLLVIREANGGGTMRADAWLTCGPDEAAGAQWFADLASTVLGEEVQR